jgi:hypothetical protein
VLRRSIVKTVGLFLNGAFLFAISQGTAVSVCNGIILLVFFFEIDLIGCLLYSSFFLTNNTIYLIGRQPNKWRDWQR